MRHVQQEDAWPAFASSRPRPAPAHLDLDPGIRWGRAWRTGAAGGAGGGRREERIVESSSVRRAQLAACPAMLSRLWPAGPGVPRPLLRWRGLSDTRTPIFFRHHHPSSCSALSLHPLFCVPYSGTRHADCQNYGHLARRCGRRLDAHFAARPWQA